MAVGDDKSADFTVENYTALKLKHPPRDPCSVPDPTDIDCFSTSSRRLCVHKTTMSFPNSCSAGLDGILPQILKDLTAKSKDKLD